MIIHKTSSNKTGYGALQFIIRIHAYNQIEIPNAIKNIPKKKILLSLRVFLLRNKIEEITPKTIKIVPTIWKPQTVHKQICKYRLNETTISLWSFHLKYVWKNILRNTLIG